MHYATVDARNVGVRVVVFQVHRFSTPFSDAKRSNKLMTPRFNASDAGASVNNAGGVVNYDVSASALDGKLLQTGAHSRIAGPPQHPLLITNKHPAVHCKVHDFSQQLDTSNPFEYECVPTKAIADLKICVYPTKKDVWVSGNIRKNGGWELDINRAIMSAMTYYANATFLDIGANIGMHSLVVAKSKRQVVAAEPKWATILRLHKSVNVNELQAFYTLIENGVSNARDALTLYSDDRNQGGASMIFTSAHRETIHTVLFDDLLEVFPHKDAVIKMDIEGAESRALLNSSSFFDAVNVHVIFMEWMGLKKVLNNPKAKQYDVFLIETLVQTLTSRGFRPAKVSQYFKESLKDANLLHLANKNNWPGDIVWVKPS